MSYQVLARKWRPRNFHQLVGQEHVARALINALDQGRLHHAYLFTGTRGVGKTTIARILAKCLNCEKGITSSPCGECEACRAIDENRFVDLIEVDAASRTKVEDTRELLDNVQYAPTQGRFKVYLIDEVHMLSSHSFNALLKTLEEPPPHVKFLLATTDPQKLPITVLSRCLQFALKAMPPERVVEHLTHVLGAESIPYDEQALWLLGRAADGSMRDALSLTDQAIAFGHGQVRDDDVKAMLGTLDQGYIIALAEALSRVDAAEVLQQVSRLAEQAPDFAAVLNELSRLFHRLAIAQMVPNALDNGYGDRDALLSLAGRFRAEDVQLYYQIALSGRSEMSSSPDARAALEMTLLRMLAFRPQGVPRPADVELPIRQRDARQSSTQGDRAVSEEGAQAEDEPGPAGSAFSTTGDTSVAAAESMSSDAISADPLSSETPSSTFQPSESSSRHQLQVEPPPWGESVPSQPVDTPQSSVSPSLSSSQASAQVPPSDAARQQVSDVQGARVDSRQSTPFGTRSDTAVDRGNETAAYSALADTSTGHQPSGQEQPIATSAISATGTPDITDTSRPQGTSFVSSEGDDDRDEDDDSYTEYAALEPTNAVNEAFSQALEESPVDEPAAVEILKPADYQLPAGTRIDHEVWLELFLHIRLGGITGNLIANCIVMSDQHNHLELRLDPTQAAMNADIHTRRLENELKRLGAERSVTITPGDIDPAIETPHIREQRFQRERRQRAVEALQGDPHIQVIREQFGARLLEESVQSRE